MAIEVRWFPTLAKRSRSGEMKTSVDWRPGLTPLAVFTAEGFTETDADALMTVVNGTRTTVETALEDGDRLEFLINLQGG
ncbi:MAG: hypothetical protein ACE5EF_06320 [Dehalococcoidia bacterium]